MYVLYDDLTNNLQLPHDGLMDILTILLSTAFLQVGGWIYDYVDVKVIQSQIYSFF